MRPLRTALAVGTGLLVIGVAIGGCREEPDASRVVSHAAPVESAGPVVDPAIEERFAGRARQRVILHLASTAEDASPLLPEASPDPDRVARRRASLRLRKDRLLAELAAAPGLAVGLIHRYPPFAMMALEVGPDEIRWLSRRPDLARIRADGEEQLDTDTSVPFTQADQLHAAAGDGTGTAIAILDTAIRYWTGEFGTCPAEGAWQNDTPGCTIAVWDNFTSYPNPPDDDPADDPHEVAKGSGHGRNVAGIAAAMAPSAKIIGLNVFRSTSQGYRARRSDVIAALAALPTYQASHGLVVANLSLGSSRTDSRPCNDSDYFEPFRSLWVDHGLLATASAGNGANAQWLTSPGCETPVVTTGAQHDAGELDDYDGSCKLTYPKAGEVACFSNLNGMLDMIAPGVRIDAAGTTRSGTSMAAPHVAGAIASLQSQLLPALADPATVTTLLMASSQSRLHNAQSYPQLDLAPVANIVGRADFPRFFKEEPSQLLPAPPHHLTLQASLSEPVTSGALLHLEVIHPSPADMAVVLHAPSGASLAFSLPADSANFNKVIGLHHLPGALSAFAGEAPGVWTLELADSVGGQRGYYISASLLAMSADCMPSCPAGSCGPDGCGGDCGSCGQGTFCDAQPGGSTCLACQPDCGGAVCGSNRCGGSCGNCDDGLFCNGNESCDDGACAAGAVPCNEVDELPCTADCSEAKRRCNAPTDGFCVIGGQCLQEGAVSPDAPCLVCDPARNDSAYSVGLGTPCDDGDPCTVDDACQGGICAGLAKDCSVTDACLVGACDPATGSCETSAEVDGAPCDDGDLCTTTSCQAGACTTEETVSCPAPGACRQLTGPCDPASGACPDAPAEDGTPCDDGGTCQGGLCEAPAPPTPADTADTDGGCGCQQPGRPAPLPGGLLLLLAVALGRRRRHQRTETGSSDSASATAASRVAGL